MLLDCSELLLLFWSCSCSCSALLLLLLLLLVDCWVLLLVGCYSECCSAWCSLWAGLVWVADAFLFLLFLLLYVLSWASGLATALGATLLLV